MASNKGNSSRQKMINLMYLVFIAMLALNVSTEVLDGFDLVNDNIEQTIQNTTIRNNQIYSEIEDSFNKNPEKTRESFDKALSVKQKTDSIFGYIQDLKLEIAKRTDGASADVNNLKNKADLEAASAIMVSPIDGKGNILKNNIDNYRDQITSLIKDSAKVNIIKNGLSTEPTQRSKDNKKNWIQGSFENMPSIAVLTYLSELQSGIKQAEGEAFTSLLKEIDFSDFRVNDVGAFVIPESNVVMRGENYKANIVLAAIDTTQRPRIVVNGTELTSNIYSVGAGSTGTFPIKGFIELMTRDGSPIRKEFSHEYTVMEPMATIAPLLMDVVYAGINNPISISVPGVVDRNVIASADGGVLVRDGNKWNAKPGKIGGKFTIIVSTNTNGATRVVARKEFRIRALPDPTPFLEYKDDSGNPRLFKRGALARSVLLNSSGVKAAIDDGILNIPFTVLSFRTVFVDAMGNAMPEVSSGSSFSARQLDQIRRMERGRYFFISGIKVKGPDGIERETSPMEIRIN